MFAALADGDLPANEASSVPFSDYLAAPSAPVYRRRGYPAAALEVPLDRAARDPRHPRIGRGHNGDDVGA